MKSSSCIRSFAIILGLFACLLGPAAAFAQMTPEQQAELLINSARKAHNEKNYAFAATKFREYLTKFGGNKNAPAARYGLALCLLDGPEKKYDEAREIMHGLSATKEFADRALAAYYAGVALRGLGLQDLAAADSKPAEAAKLRASAQVRFNDAIPLFTSAITALLGKVEEATDGMKLSLEAEWVARARCDLAEMQLRVGKWKECQTSAAPFVADPLWSKSQYRNLGRYYHGYASVLLKEPIPAEKTLGMLAPFNDPVFGNHARYLLARTHHLADERAEATTHYEGTIGEVSERNAEYAPGQLSNKAGGELPTVTDPQGRERLTSIAYEATVLLDEESALLRAGMRGRSRFLVGHRSAWQWTWRWITHTFHFRL